MIVSVKESSLFERVWISSEKTSPLKAYISAVTMIMVTK